jgi:hypothetical protein
MAFIRNIVTIAVTVLCIVINTKAQTIYYPAQSSQLLKATAEDAAILLQKAIPESKFDAQAYTIMPASGIIFIYDNTIADYQSCQIVSNGIDNIKLSANGDNGLHFGIYQYLHYLGYRFYQPGTIWELIPQLSSACKKLDTTFTCSYKYKTWFISGGYSRWLMDNGNNYKWDSYGGDNGHNWALYQRRNGMLGSSSFGGHRDDIMNGNYLNTLKSNPCYVANYNGSRQATSQSVPDIYNNNAINLWANAIEQKYTVYKNNIFGNSHIPAYADFYRNFKYNYNNIGIEVPDAAQWGNSKENDSCGAVNYPTESDQHFILANATVQKILAKFPEKKFQIYAYSGHADVPSLSIAIHKNIDIQIIPAVYQVETSTNGLRNRWYNRSTNISEYHYLNLSGWSGETPSFKWSELKTTLQIAKEKKSQGIIWEASPAKFGSLPYLLAANNYLKDNTGIDNTLHEFCNNMFDSAGNTIYKMLQMWGDENIGIDKYKMQLYIQLMNTAIQQTLYAPDIIKERLRELKAYLHYMVMYFDLENDDQNKSLTKKEKHAALCIYIAQINRLQLVNSYYLIKNIVSKYPATDDFKIKFNVLNGTAYQNGNLPLITAYEIDNNFEQDLVKYGNQIQHFKLEEAAFMKGQFKTANIIPLPVINTKITYTNGANYYNKTSFSFIAPQAGSFSIKYTPLFGVPDKGYINFTVESSDKALRVIKDFSIDNSSSNGIVKVDVPEAGNYILTVTSKYKSAVNLAITTNNNYFYKYKAFLGNTTESYRDDWASLPGYFYIPNGISSIYCNAKNFNGTKFASPDAINRSFGIKDNNGNPVQLKLASPSDSSLFYLEIPSGASGSFWQVTTMAQYSLQFVNISNILWYAQRKACTNASFIAAIVNKNGNCFTRLSTTANAANLSWQVNDKSRISKYTNQSTVDLPDYISPNAVITLTNGEGCSFTKALANDEKYLRAKEACASGAPIAAPIATPVLYPNPSTGIFNCLKDGSITLADEIVIYNTQGTKVANFKSVKQFNISNVTSGLYFYQIIINGITYSGKVMKL